MTDLDLLKKAARAAGYANTHAWSDKFAVWAGGDYVLWNPLEDDGDAFRLMTELMLDVEINCNIVTVTTPEYDEFDEETGDWGPLIDRDAMRTATRRAIVRAAAAMGAAQ